eukprot:TRINITY_DN7987_c0_g1_i1.p1 TRINITY_DN7987_c0_g1~~TRINITY_DN7987_c0_g1_i1.p1  ORF type:complete len:216 (+),score=23.84 TRINITY_DN7987_c0_g1_i1:101-748(+)
MVPPPQKSDAYFQAIWTGVTNLAMLPALTQCFRMGYYYDFVIGLMAMLTSSAYHVCQSLDYHLLGFNEGRWHHMDNVFAISSIMCIIIGFVQLPRGSALREFINTASISIVVAFQVLAPWNIWYTVAPIGAAVFVTLFGIIYQRRLPRLEKTASMWCFVHLVAAVVCFVRGLDDDNDRFRLWHGGWHIFVGCFVFFARRAQNPSRKIEVAMAKEA